MRRGRSGYRRRSMAFDPSGSAPDRTRPRLHGLCGRRTDETAAADRRRGRRADAGTGLISGRMDQSWDGRKTTAECSGRGAGSAAQARSRRFFTCTCTFWPAETSPGRRGDGDGAGQPHFRSRVLGVPSPGTPGEGEIENAIALRFGDSGLRRQLARWPPTRPTVI